MSNNEIVEHQPAPLAPRLGSEDIVVSAPMSYHGSAARIWKITRGGGDQWWAVMGIGVLAALLIACAWVAVTCWYLFFGLLLIPYRLVRRGQRKRKLEAARHRELLSATQPRRDD